MVRDINAGSNSSFPYGLVDLNGTLLFTADDGASGFELFFSDGSFAGTQQLIDIYPGATGSNPFIPANGVIGNTAYFSATDPTNGSELWKTDGTTAGTAWIQTSSATVDLKAAISSARASAGVLHPRVFLGRLFIRFATSFSHVWLAPFRSVPLGMN